MNTPETLSVTLLSKLADLQGRKREELRGTAPDQRSLAQSLRKVYDLGSDSVRVQIENQISKGRGNMAPDLWKNFEAITAPKSTPPVDKFKVLCEYLNASAAAIDLLIAKVESLEKKLEASKTKKKGASAPEPVSV